MNVGKFYRVPCVKTNKPLWLLDAGYSVPVIGPAHEDSDVINFPEDHWHVDWRFVTNDFFEFHTRFRAEPGGTVISVRNTTSEVFNRRIKCRREMPAFPNGAPWQTALEKAYADCRLKPGLVCPHRGIPLAGVPSEGGVIVCPGHGLAWNAATGEMVKRKPN